MTHRTMWYNLGRDRRRIPGKQSQGMYVRSDYGGPLAQNVVSSLINIMTGPSTGQIARGQGRPYTIIDPPFSADNLGQPFPPGTIWVVPSFTADDGLSASNLRAPGTITNPLTVTGGVYLPTTNELFYIAYGMPSGASVSVTATSLPSNTPLFSFMATANGSSLIYEITPFSAPSTDTSTSTVIVWTGGIPIQEGINSMPRMVFEGGAIAVPSALPAGYTANHDSTCRYAAPFGYRSCGDSRRLRAGPNTTYESMGFGDNSSFGFAPTSSNVWIGGKLWGYPWSPVAVGQATDTFGGGFVVGGSGFGGSSTVAGYRYAQISFQYTKNFADPLPSDVVNYSVTQDGSTIFSSSAMGSSIKSIPTQVLSVTLPPAGTMTTFVLSVSGSAGGSPGDWGLTITVGGSFRCDIPLPFSCSGPGGVAPGGYLAGMLTTPANAQPLTRLPAGTSSTMLSSPGNLAFLPSTDGWWQVTQDGSPLAGIGEDDFGWTDLRTMRRGRAKRPFYAPCPSPGSPSTFALVAAAPPAPTAIASGGTLVTLGSGSFAAWCSIALPSAGTWKIKIAAGTISACGMVADVSMTDPAVINPQITRLWEPYIEHNTAIISDSFKGVASTPPIAPNNYDSWIIGINATGAWSGRENQIATWDPGVGAWQFSVPYAGDNANSVIPFHPDHWYDVHGWHTNGTDPQLTIPITTTGPQTAYLCLQPFDGMETGLVTATISWGAA